MGKPPFNSRLALPSFMVALFIPLLILKLTDILTWSWVWITCPIWILPVLYFLALLVIIVEPNLEKQWHLTDTKS